MSMTLVVFLAGVALLSIVVLPSGMRAYRSYRAPRRVRCPKAGAEGEVRIDAWHAAVTAFPGPPRIHVEHCSLWPDYAGCGDACAPG